MEIDEDYEPRSLTSTNQGRSGEYLVLADLTIKGFIASDAHEGAVYDLTTQVNECNESREFVKIQVKTTSHHYSKQGGTSQYHFRTCHGNPKKIPYNSREIDIFALVALDTRQIAYVHVDDAPSIDFAIRSDEFRGQYTPEQTFIRCQHIRNLHESGMKQVDISKLENMHQSTISNIVNMTTEQVDALYLNTKKILYFSDFTLEKALDKLNIDYYRLGMTNS